MVTVNTTQGTFSSGGGLDSDMEENPVTIVASIPPDEHLVFKCNQPGRCESQCGWQRLCINCESVNLLAVRQQRNHRSLDEPDGNLRRF